MKQIVQVKLKMFQSLIWSSRMLRGAPRDFYQDMQQKVKKHFRVFGDAKVNHGNGLSGTGASATPKVWDTMSTCV